MYNKHNLEDDLIRTYGEDSEQVATFRQLIAIYYASQDNVKALEKKNKFLEEKAQYLSEDRLVRVKDLKVEVDDLLTYTSKKDTWNIHKPLIQNIRRILKKY